MAVQALSWLQLLEHGANVHNHGGGRTNQTPLHLAVADLNMDAGLIELLVSYGASPFLEASDGVQPFVALMHPLHVHSVLELCICVSTVLHTADTRILHNCYGIAGQQPMILVSK